MADAFRQQEIADFQRSKKGAKFGLSTEVMCDYCKKYFLHIQRCGRCRIAWYCSRECQKMDWSTHRHVCAAEEKKRREEEAKSGVVAEIAPAKAAVAAEHRKVGASAATGKVRKEKSKLFPFYSFLFRVCPIIL